MVMCFHKDQITFEGEIICTHAFLALPRLPLCSCHVDINYICNLFIIVILFCIYALIYCLLQFCIYVFVSCPCMLNVPLFAKLDLFLQILCK